MTATSLQAAAATLARVPGVAVVMVVLLTGFATTSPNFLSAGNIANILVQ